MFDVYQRHSLHPQALIIKACQAVDSKPAIVTTARSNSHIPLMQTGIHCWLLVSVVHRLLLAYRAAIFTYWHHVKYMISYNPIQVRFIAFAQRHTLRYVNHTDHLVRIPKNWTQLGGKFILCMSQTFRHSPSTSQICSFSSGLGNDGSLCRQVRRAWCRGSWPGGGSISQCIHHTFLIWWHDQGHHQLVWIFGGSSFLNVAFSRNLRSRPCEMMAVEDFCRATCRTQSWSLVIASCPWKLVAISVKFADQWIHMPLNACWNSLLSGLCITRQPWYSHLYHDHTRVYSVYSHDSWMFSFLRMHVEVQWSLSIVLSVLHPPK